MDEVDQSVLYNILHWPTKLHSKLIVIDKLLPRAWVSKGFALVPIIFNNFKKLFHAALMELKHSKGKLSKSLQERSGSNYFKRCTSCSIFKIVTC